MLESRGAGFLLLDKNKNEILVLKRSKESSYPDHWCLPGGKVDDEDYDIFGSYDESILNGAKRELFEETKIKISYLRGNIFKNFIDTNRNKFLFRTFIFILKNNDRELIESVIKLDHEHQEWKFEKIDVLKKSNSSHPGLINTLNVLKLYGVK